jgi:glycosyltransferase involved in cell wall biosynthesis
MKVLLTTGIYPPEIGGPATYIPQLARHLIECGHEVTVLTLRKKNIRSEENQAWKVRYVPIFSFLPLRVLATIVTIAILARRHDYIFSNGLYFETGLALAVVKRSSVVKVVGNPIWERSRNKKKYLAESENEYSSQLNKLQKFQLRAIVFALSRFNWVTCPSQALCEDVWGWGLKSRPIFIPNGVNVREPVSGKKDIDVIAVSRLVNWKNIDVLIESCASLGVKLWVIGDGPELAHLKNHTVSVEADVVFVGELPASEIPEYLDRSRCYVLISNYEGLSFSLLEAMNCRVPVVVSDVPGNRSVVQSAQNGVIVRKISVSEVSKAISKILHTDNSGMIENAHQLIRGKYDIQSNFRKILELLDSR